MADKETLILAAEAMHGDFADHNGDKDKARRYASTRAAAFIGRER